jgi:hypothetical protein
VAEDVAQPDGDARPAHHPLDLGGDVVSSPPARRHGQPMLRDHGSGSGVRFGLGGPNGGRTTAAIRNLPSGNGRCLSAIPEASHRTECPRQCQVPSQGGSSVSTRPRRRWNREGPEGSTEPWAPVVSGDSHSG